MSLKSKREAWLDALRGVTISLVVLHHSNQAVGALLKESGRELHFLVYNVSNLLGLVRMPAFFLCSGILFAIPARRGWTWFLNKRLAWTAWIAVLWGSIAALLVAAELHYMWEYSGKVTLLQAMMLDPIGNMWFIYAIAILGAYCMVIRRMDPSSAMALSIILSIALTLTVRAFEFPYGIELVMANLGMRGLIFFTAGFILHDQLLKPRPHGPVLFTCSILVWCVCYYITKNATFAVEFHKMLLRDSCDGGRDRKLAVSFGQAAAAV